MENVLVNEIHKLGYELTEYVEKDSFKTQNIDDANLVLIAKVDLEFYSSVDKDNVSKVGKSLNIPEDFINENYERIDKISNVRLYCEIMSKHIIERMRKDSPFVLKHLGELGISAAISNNKEAMNALSKYMDYDIINRKYFHMKVSVELHKSLSSNPKSLYYKLVKELEDLKNEDKGNEENYDYPAFPIFTSAGFGIYHFLKRFVDMVNTFESRNLQLKHIKEMINNNLMDSNDAIDCIGRMYITSLEDNKENHIDKLLKILKS